MTAFVKAGDRVLLKPNLLTGARLDKECTTRAELVYCVAQMVRAVGAQPFLGDSPAFGRVSEGVGDSFTVGFEGSGCIGNTKRL